MSRIRPYLDFALELRDLGPDGSSYTVAPLPSQELGEIDPAVVQLRRDELRHHLEDLQDKRIYPEDLIQLGERLTDRLLPEGPIREGFRRAVQRAGRDGGVRLRLLIRDPRLAQLPWEYCYLPLHPGDKDRNHFLVLNPQLSLVRHPPLEGEQPSLTGHEPDRLRMVVTTANPDAPGLSRLNLRRERRVIEEALGEFDVDGVTLDRAPVIEDVSADEMAKVLVGPIDLFHFAGHGLVEETDIDPASGEPSGNGVLVLVRDRETGAPEHLPADTLARQLQGAGVRVAVLGACQSGRHDGLSAWAGVAPALVARGVGAVVGMQYDVRDQEAIAFSRMFYTSLAAGLSIDQAVSAGRQAMLGQANEDSVEWGVPALYMRSPDGVLFPELARRPSPTADQITATVQQVIGTIAVGGKVTGIRVGPMQGGKLEVSQRVDTVQGEIIAVDLRKSSTSRGEEMESSFRGEEIDDD